MKNNIKYKILILIFLAAVVMLIAAFLHNLSYNPSFSAIDIFTSASQKAKMVEGEEKTVDYSWEYEASWLALDDESLYEEKSVTTENREYRLLWKKASKENAISNGEKIVILSDKHNPLHVAAVKDVTKYLEGKGYNVRIKSCTKSMMHSLGHAGKFDVFLLNERGE